ncbi:AraC family transcriptional regulator [Chitinibacteraceae bacterium HSL-7]
MSGIYLEQFDVSEHNRQQSVGGRIYFHPCVPALQRAGMVLLGTSEITDTYSVERHGAPFHVVVVCEHGSGFILDKDEQHRISVGELAILPAGSQSGLLRDPNEAVWRFAWFLLEPGAAWPMLDASPLRILPCDDSRSVWLATEMMAREARQARPLSAVALELLKEVLRRALTPRTQTKARQQLEQLFAEISQNPARDWRVDELAQRWGVSASRFQRICTQLLGHGPRDEILARRMQCAKSLLLQGQHSVAAVAEQVGYQEVASFSRRFTRHFGEPPSSITQYLKQGHTQ